MNYAIPNIHTLTIFETRTNHFVMVLQSDRFLASYIFVFHTLLLVLYDFFSHFFISFPFY